MDAATADVKTNVAAMTKAVTAIEKGMGGFLLIAAASTLRSFATNSNKIADAEAEGTGSEHDQCSPPPPQISSARLHCIVPLWQEDWRPPESFEASSNGIIAMIDLLIKDLDKEMMEAELMEKDAQEDYEVFMKESADKRAQDSKTLNDKEGAFLKEQKGSLASTEKESAATSQHIHSLHLGCDRLIQAHPGDCRT